MAIVGVYPVYDNDFKIETTKTPTPVLSSIADMESFSVSFDNGIEEWTPMTSEGWVRRLMTAKSVTIAINGKRNVGDAGNDFVAGLMFKSGADATHGFEWTLPDGTKVEMDAVINLTSVGGDSTNVDGLEFEVMSDGKPTVTPVV